MVYEISGRMINGLKIERERKMLELFKLQEKKNGWIKSIRISP